MSHIDPSVMRALGLNDQKYNPINYETDYHRLNRKGSLRWVFAVFAGALVVAVLAGFIIKGF